MRSSCPGKDIDEAAGLWVWRSQSIRLDFHFKGVWLMGFNNANPEDVCTPMEFYAHIKDLIKIETDLVDKRLNILLLIQGALMSAHTYSEVLSIKVGVIIVASLTTVTMFFTLKRNAYSIAFILRRWDSFLEGKNLRNTAFPPVWAGSAPVPDFFLQVG